MIWFVGQKSVLRWLLLMLAITTSNVVVAHSTPKDKQSYVNLPGYCVVKMGFGTKSQWDMWSERLPGGFNHIHHYCFAMHQYSHIQRIFPRNKKEDLAKRSYIKDALNNIAYMETHAGDKFILMPEIMVLKGRVLMAADRKAAAIVAYRHAMRLKPDYTKAYTALSDVYKKMANIEMAKQTLEEGLKRSPNSKALKRRLKKLSR